MKPHGNRRKTALLTAAAAVLLAVLFFLLYYLLEIRVYTAAHFGIRTLKSEIDYDHDGIDDYTDILQGARAYIQTDPFYQSAYYEGGYPEDGIGVCTDVIWNAFANAGYCLKDLVDADIAENPEAYPTIAAPDPNIDFRRVRNLKIFFERNAQVLPTDTSDPAAWQPGDIVVYEPSHIAIISDRRNGRGLPYIIHHGSNPAKEENALTAMRIIGHYRWNGIDARDGRLK